MVTMLKAEERNSTTKSERKGLRANGKIPGVLYGANIKNTTITIDEKALLALLRTNPHAVVEMELPKLGKQSVMINEIQRDALSRNVLHVDFHQINMNEPVSTTVRLEFTGDPAGVRAGGILQVQLHELAIRCLPDQIPNSIQVDVSDLEVGSNLLVSAIQVADSIEIKTDENDVLVTILAPQKEAEEPEAAEADDPKAEASSGAHEAESAKS